MAGGTTAIGALGGLPKSPIAINPSLRCNDSAAQVNIICCSHGARASNSFDNRRIVYRNGKLDETKNNGKISKLFKQLCCCFGSDETVAEKNVKAIGMIEAFLVQQYGETAAKIAPHYARIDLNEKKETGASLLVREFRDLDRAAQEVRLYEPDLNKIARALKFYHRQQHLEENDIPIVPFQKEKIHSKERVHLSVTHSNGQKEKFKTKNVKTCLRELPTSKVIPDLELKEIIAQVRKELKARELNEASTETIRGILAQELKERGYEIKLPIQLDTSLLESFKVTGFNPKLYVQLLNAIKQEFVRAEDSTSNK